MYVTLHQMWPAPSRACEGELLLRRRAQATPSSATGQLLCPMPSGKLSPLILGMAGWHDHKDIYYSHPEQSAGPTGNSQGVEVIWGGTQ